MWSRGGNPGLHVHAFRASVGELLRAMVHPSPDLRSLPEALGHLSPAQLNALADPVVRGLLQRFVSIVHAHEIAVWAKDPEANQLVPFLDTAGPAGGFEMSAAQSLERGIVSRVFREHSSFLERGLWRSRERSPEIDMALQQVTQNEMCVPFYLYGHLVGVVSAVQLTDRKHSPPKRWGFEERDLEVLAVAAEAVAQSLERAWYAQRLAGASGAPTPT